MEPEGSAPTKLQPLPLRPNDDTSRKQPETKGRNDKEPGDVPSVIYLQDDDDNTSKLQPQSVATPAAPVRRRRKKGAMFALLKTVDPLHKKKAARRRW
mmetsp:Transcript_108155/g.161796  ORF Transcript_108155/g.161796 Transcript_108155/m.161796 type:complete len:98 (-) Transcript_108155:134-427(-)